MTELTFYPDEEPRPVEVGTPVYDSDGRLVARVTAVDSDGTVTIGAPDRGFFTYDEHGRRVTE